MAVSLKYSESVKSNIVGNNRSYHTITQLTLHPPQSYHMHWDIQIVPHI